MNASKIDWDFGRVMVAISALLGVIGWASFLTDGPSPLIAVTLLNSEFFLIKLIGWTFYIYEYLCMGLVWIFIPALYKIFRKQDEDI